MTQPFYKMTDEEARSFAYRQALGAAETTCFRTDDGTRGMTESDVRQYASAILSAIRYFNLRDPRHSEEMRYRELCKKQQAAQNRPTQRNAEQTEVCFL